MNQLNELNVKTLTATCYLDESGSDEKNTICVLGGLLFNKTLFSKFDEAWVKMLAHHNIKYPLHMRAICRPDGTSAKLTYDERTNLFKDVATLINQHKIYSAAVVIDQTEFWEYFSVQTSRKFMSAYSLAFIIYSALNSLIAEKRREKVQVDYIVDKNDFFPQVSAGYQMLTEIQKDRDIHLGIFQPGNDEKISALQAADVVAWASRRKAERGNLPEGFESLENILSWQKTVSGRDVPHFGYPVPRRILAEMAKSLNHWLDGAKVGSKELRSFIKLPPDELNG